MSTSETPQQYPVQHHTRVVTTTMTGFVDPRVDETVSWEGTDTDELSLEFPPSTIWGADPLGRKEIEDGFIRISSRFEEQLEDGSWEEIDDPRRRLTPMTDLEQEIDEENRRLYPGDYLTDDDCDRCGGYGCDECEDPYNREPEYECDYCRDFGCSACEPEKYCDDCGDSLSHGDGPLCTRCQDYIEQYADHPCRDCGSVPVTYDVDICNDCERKLYVQEMEAAQALEDCIAYCKNCGKELSHQETTLCTACDEYERQLEASYGQYEDDLGDTEDNRSKRAFSWFQGILHRFYHRIMS